MNEMAPIDGNSKFIDRYVSPFGSMYVKEGISYAVSNSGELAVPIPDELADSIQLALKVQDKVFSGKYPKLERLLSVLNCRKTALIASGEMDLKDATNPDSGDLSGVEKLFSDVDRIQNSGYHPAIISSPKDLYSYLDRYEGSFPCIVHLFGLENNSPLSESVKSNLDETNKIEKENIKKLHRVHSFLVLGEEDAGYVVFQKTGPEPVEPFVITSLDNVVEPLVAEMEKKGRRGISFVGPLSR